ncbi:MAG TPA: hypothetical protein PKE32_08880 [Miltoncostaeaceae bacterium]|nr:hypothetical protein [Miltoncostaeaceae bacterium]
MRGELLKLRCLPTPRWTLVGVVLMALLGLAGAARWGIGEDDLAVSAGAVLPTSIAAIVLGSWLVGVEYGQNTMRRLLGADPRRLRAVGRKLMAGAGATLALTLVAFLILLLGLSPIAAIHDQSVSMEHIARMGVAAAIGNLSLAAVGVACVLLTRSMAGGITVAFAYTFVLDAFLSAIPRVGRFTAASASSDVWSALTDSAGDARLLPAVALLLAWCAALLAAGILRFVRQDA